MGNITSGSGGFSLSGVSDYGPQMGNNMANSYTPQTYQVSNRGAQVAQNVAPIAPPPEGSGGGGGGTLDAVGNLLTAGSFWNPILGIAGLGMKAAGMWMQKNENDKTNKMTMDYQTKRDAVADKQTAIENSVANDVMNMKKSDQAQGRSDNAMSSFMKSANSSFEMRYMLAKTIGRQS